ELILGGVQKLPRVGRVAAAGVGVVDQDVDPPEPLDGRLDDALHIRGVAGVAVDDLGLAAGLGDQFGDLFGVADARLGRQVADDDPGALASVGQRDASPD